MNLTRRGFLSGMKNVLCKTAIFASLPAFYSLFDELATSSQSKKEINESISDEHYGFSFDKVKEFRYEDKENKKTISIYVENESTFNDLKNSLEFMKAERPIYYENILNKIKKIKEAYIFDNKDALMSVIPGSDIVYFNKSNLNSIVEIEAGCALSHEAEHIDGHGELLAYINSFRCLVEK